MRAGYDVRTPRESDLPSIVDAVNAAARANDSTAGAQTGDEFLRAWAQMDSAEDAWVVTGPNDGIYGYGHVIAALREGRIFADAYTHPDHLGAGIGTTLLTHIEARAAAMAPGIASGGEATDVALVNYVLLGGDADRMLRARGYHLARIHKRMRTTLDTPLVAPVWPSEVSVRTCTGTAEDLRRVHECVEEAFGDRWGRAPRSYDQWAEDMIYEGSTLRSGSSLNAQSEWSVRPCVVSARSTTRLPARSVSSAFGAKPDSSGSAGRCCWPVLRSLPNVVPLPSDLMSTVRVLPVLTVFTNDPG